jgi:hypothetical protein
VETSRERWLELCELTANEQDSKKLLALIEEINLLLEAEIRDVAVKRRGLADNPPTPAD